MFHLFEGCLTFVVALLAFRSFFFFFLLACSRSVWDQTLFFRVYRVSFTRRLILASCLTFPVEPLCFTTHVLPAKALVEEYGRNQAKAAKKDAGKAKEPPKGEKEKPLPSSAKKSKKKAAVEPAKAISAASLVTNHDSGGEHVEWEATAVTGERQYEGKTQFLVEWAKTNTGTYHAPEWCDEEQLERARDLIETFRASARDAAESDASAKVQKVDKLLEGYGKARATDVGVMLRRSLQVALDSKSYSRRYFAAGPQDVKGNVVGEKLGNGDASFFRMGVYDKERDQFIGPGTVVGGKPSIIIGVQFSGSHWQAVQVKKDLFSQSQERDSTGATGSIRFFEHTAFPLNDVSLDEELVQSGTFWEKWGAWADRYLEDFSITIKKPSPTASKTPRRNPRRGSGTSPYEFRSLKSAERPKCDWMASDDDNSADADIELPTPKRKRGRKGKSPKRSTKGTKKACPEEEPAPQETQPGRVTPLAPPQQLVEPATAAWHTKGGLDPRVVAMMAMQAQKIIMLEEQERKRKEQDGLEQIMGLFHPK